LSPTGDRDADRYLNFDYDLRGNLIQDVSKNLVAAHAYDGMPTAFTVRSGAKEAVLHQLYDASGRKVSQVEVSRLSSGFPVYVTGIPEHWSEEGLYDAATAWDAWGDANYLLNFRGYPAPDTVHFFVVLDEGETELDPESHELDPLQGPHGEVPVVMHALIKYSGAYDNLLVQKAGRMVAARHAVNMGGQITSEVRESYDENGGMEDRRILATVFGRGVPVGRYIVNEGRYQFYVKNHLGSTVRVVEADGSYDGTPVFDYQPHGEAQVVREDSEYPVTQTFTGKQLDPGVNLYYFGARWYDAELGMWISPDPARQFGNHYAYGWDPINFHDPDGLWKFGLGISVGYTRRGGFSLGLGVGLEDVNLGVAEINTYVGADHNFRSGSETYSAQAGGSACAGLCLGAGAGGSYDTKSGYTAHAFGSVGVGMAVNAQMGVEVGTDQYWTKQGQYVGGTMYGEAFAQAFSTRASAGYSHGFGAVESGYYTNLGAGGLSIGYHTARGVNYGVKTRVAALGYESEKGLSHNYTGSDLLGFLRSEPTTDPEPASNTPTGWFGTNWCGPGGAGDSGGMLNGACYAHDATSERLKASGIRGALTVNDWGLIAADFKLTGAAFQSVGAEGSAYGHLVGATFFTLGSYKTLTRLSTHVAY
jgi:RHS repeat-associated protein